jgi:tRNA 2-selenouridine synthase
MAEVLTAQDFLKRPGVLLDVRSPGEYEHGHIPEAISFPLFTNQERAEVGTCYKHQGRDAAVELGLAIAGPKLAPFVQRAKQLAPDRVLRIHCWRGGMRSGSMAWLMETAGFQVTLLDKGYKGFRQWGRETLATPRPILTLGGMTGTGKTAVLYALAQQGEQILDLEALANHRGSSYGGLGLPPQPSTEQFENLLAIAWSNLDVHRPVWLEAESRMVGKCRIPDHLFQAMRQAPILQLERSLAERIGLLLEIYGPLDRQQLITATTRIEQRLGGQQAKQAVEHIRQEQLAQAIAIILNYYDKTYKFDLKRRGAVVESVPVTGLSAAESAAVLIERARSRYPLHQMIGNCSQV